MDSQQALPIWTPACEGRAVDEWCDGWVREMMGTCLADVDRDNFTHGRLAASQPRRRSVYGARYDRRRGRTLWRWEMKGGEEQPAKKLARVQPWGLCPLLPASASTHSVRNSQVTRNALEHA